MLFSIAISTFEANGNGTKYLIINFIKLKIYSIKFQDKFIISNLLNISVIIKKLKNKKKLKWKKHY